MAVTDPRLRPEVPPGRPSPAATSLGHQGIYPVSGPWSVAGGGINPPGDNERRASSASTRWMSSIPADASSGWVASPSACLSRRRSETGTADNRWKDLKALPDAVRPSVVSSEWEQSALEFKIGALFECQAGRLLNPGSKLPKQRPLCHGPRKTFEASGRRRAD